MESTVTRPVEGRTRRHEVPEGRGEASVRTYRGTSLKEALGKVRRDLGADAIILGTRTVRRRGWLGFGRGLRVEVRAAKQMPAAIAVRRPHVLESRGSSLSTTPSTSTSTTIAKPSSRGAGSTPTPAVQTGRRGHAPNRSVPTATDANGAVRQQFDEQLGQLHANVEDLSRRGRLDHLVPDLPTEMVPIYARLVEVDVPEGLATRLIQLICESVEPGERSDPSTLRSILREAVEACISTAPPIRMARGQRRVVALVGPTGVGKTTTVAKLAATYKLTHGVRTGLITADTYRIAAIEQLKTYAEIIDVPLAVAPTATEVVEALSRLGAVDLVLVDTAGHGRQDRARWEALGALLRAVRPDEIHLVLSAVASPRALRDAAAPFTEVAANRLILTKLDEATALGPLLALLAGDDRPVSYLATGQGVPDDLEPARPDRLARLILGEEVIASRRRTAEAARRRAP